VLPKYLPKMTVFWPYAHDTYIHMNRDGMAHHGTEVLDIRVNDEALPPDVHCSPCEGPFSQASAPATART
jgi:hypothetical protein